jgi:hypothetical protein
MPDYEIDTPTYKGKERRLENRLIGDMLFDISKNLESVKRKTDETATAIIEIRSDQKYIIKEQEKVNICVFGNGDNEGLKTEVSKIKDKINNIPLIVKIYLGISTFILAVISFIITHLKK